MTSPLAEVRRATQAKRRAEERYRAALVAAVDALDNDRGAYVLVAEAAGVSRQAVRQLVRRERIRPPS